MVVNNTVVKLELTQSQAIVLFEWLSRSDKGSKLHVSDPSEQKVLWLLEGKLEKVLLEPLAPDYAKRLEGARKEVNDGG